jgi:hypothetical protein
MPIAALLAAGVVLVLATESAASPSVIDVPVTPLLVRLYVPPQLSPYDSRSALAETKAILAEAGFASEWITCDVDPSAPPRCTVPLTGGELAIRLATAPQPLSLRRAPLGYSLLDVATQSGSLATVYLDRVRWLAGPTAADVATLLGRAMAHELGHLLLGTARHGPSGLMRAIWSRHMIRNSHPHEWRFSAHEARQMRAAVSARAAAAQPARAD